MRHFVIFVASSMISVSILVLFGVPFHVAAVSAPIGCGMMGIFQYVNEVEK